MCFCRSPPSIPTLDMILAECKQLPGFPIVSKNILRKWCKNLNLAIKKCRCINNLMLIWCHQPVAWLKMKLQHRCFFYEFWEMFQPATILKTTIRHRYFPVNFEKFLRTLVLENICERLLLVLLDFLWDWLFIKMENKRISKIITP